MKKKLAILLSFVLLIGALIPTNVSAETVEQIQSICIIGMPAPEVDPHQIDISFKDGDGSQEEIAAEEEFWGIVQEYADPECFSLDYTPSRFIFDRDMTEAEETELKGFVNDITRNDTTDLQKIKSIVEWEAENIYYDLDFYSGVAARTNTCPYDVYKNRYTVCMGYANMANALLDYAGIHNLMIIAPNHGYNAAWSKEEERWVIFDATWCSNNSYNGGVFTYEEASYECFDMTPAYLAGLSSHAPEGVKGLKDSETGIYYELNTRDDFTDTSNWKMYVNGTIPGVETIILHKSFLGYPVVNCISIGNDITEVIFEDGWTEIPDWVLRGGRTVTSVILPDSVKTIGYGAFGKCSKLTSLNIPDSVEVIREEAFSGDESLNSIVIGAGVEKIGSRAFIKCTNLKNITIKSEKITSFGTNTFMKVPKSAKIKVPASVKKVYKKMLKKAGFKGKVK